MTKSRHVLLAIESSCDDTGASVMIDAKIASNVVSSQVDHAKWGGVVPELASRKHMEAIGRVVDQALENAGVRKNEINAIAFTRGPGLMGALLVGVSFAKAMAHSLNIPIIEVNHMEAHILAHFIEPPVPEFPFLCLTVSGGHTEIVNVEAWDRMTILGKTLDDAAGEAFDKAGKIMGLPYPAGPLIDRLASHGKPVFQFPQARVKKFHYSFSGLKTAFLYFLQEQMKKDPGFIEKNKTDIAASLQHAIIESLTEPLILASREMGIKRIAIAGGVSANSGLRKKMESLRNEENWEIFIPRLEFCTDNAAMIAQAAWFKYQAKQYAPLHITADPRLAVKATKA